MAKRISSVAWVLGAVTIASFRSNAYAGFLDLTSVSSKGFGDTFNGFTGTLDGNLVTGSAVSTAKPYVFSPVGPGTSIDSTISTIDNGSPQYSYASVFDPVVPLTDRVGFASVNGAAAVVTITFATPVTNPHFHIAGMSGPNYTFALTDGLTSVSTVRSNGGFGDGFQLVGNTVSDALGGQYQGVRPMETPQLSGPRAAYGTISLNGTFTTLTINVACPGAGGGSFTLSSVPEPLATSFVGIGCAVLLGRRWRARA
ncbi:MAG: hypothetical protein JWM57_1607 [Phycisphaerales bacterium]|nr:hypothetical protein [Phycisphaerales bacterium]